MNTMTARGSRFALAIGTALLIVACGGGGGTSSVPSGGASPGGGTTPGGGTSPGGGTTPGGGTAPGGGTGGGTSGTGAPIVSGGAMVKGSVILNGIRFDDTAAVIGDDRNRKRDELADGMIVKVRGRSDDNVNGVAERVEVENELRAAIQAPPSTANNTQSFLAGGVTVIVDGQTVYANFGTGASFANLAKDQRVEVHGLRDANGNLRATRVELVLDAGVPDELRGVIANLNVASSQFTLNGSITVNYAGATFSPAGTTAAALATGLVVEVRGALNTSTNVFAATQVDVEKDEDQGLEAKENEKTEYEGLVSGFSAHPGKFQVNSREVQTISSTRFVGGTSADLANNVKVEAEGVTLGGVLVASKIEFKQTRVLLYGKVTAMNASGGQFTVLGQTVVVNAQTDIVTRSAGGNSGQLADLLVNECVEVKAYLDGATITASEVKEPSGCNDELVQARVVFKDEATSTLRFLNNNLTANLAGATKFKDANDQPLTRTQFFAAIVPAGSSNVGTLVKVKGPTLSTADEAELEN